MASAHVASPPRQVASMPQLQKKHTKGLPALIAGACAGATEITITYPFESAKTRSQLKRGVSEEVQATLASRLKGWYVGYTASVTGTTIKAAIQFASYHLYSSALAGPNGEMSATKTLVAGFAAGVTESVLAVTPFECIKTKMIHARRLGNAQMNTVTGAVLTILREQGPRGFFAAVVPTTLRQSSNAAVKFGVYSQLMQRAKRSGKDGKVHPLVAVLIGSVSGLCCACSTQPLDVVKTRMQSIQAQHIYGNAFNCVRVILREEGIAAFWSGIWHRLGRLSVASAIMFPV
ncbi:uncharacterized protein ATNIH1004_005252 [Aspergillus tanneri]|nr:uncharacterized protein ATNIH1004_005252 [Aspergillus tanneri]KAA8649351.1 hypothetical protein ATNIH1004_005252 [Aspergillus tanneri]